MEMAALPAPESRERPDGRRENDFKEVGNADAEPCGKQYHGEQQGGYTLHALMAIGVLLVGRFAACFTPIITTRVLNTSEAE